MKNFEVVYTNQPWRNRSFKVRGVCQFDVLNPCWDNRPTDIPGKHWGGDDLPACAACCAEAAKAKGGAA